MATETLRPNGDDTIALSRSPSSGYNYQKIDDESPDDASTFVYGTSVLGQTDIYTMTDMVNTPTTINSLTVYYRCLSDADNCRAEVKVNGYSGAGPITISDSAWTTYDYTWNTNPATSAAWTKSAIDSLKISLWIEADAPGDVPMCTQLYAVVDYNYTSHYSISTTANLTVSADVSKMVAYVRKIFKQFLRWDV